MPERRAVREMMQELREARGDRCEFCGETEGLQFAHVKPTKLNGRSRGGPNRYYDIKKHPESYRLLCPECHSKYDEDSEVPF